MITVRQGGKVYGPGVFMFESEAAAVKTELLARNTIAAKRLADEIGMPGDGTAYSNCSTTKRETVDDILETMRRVDVEHSAHDIRELADRLTNALKIERAIGGND